MQAAETVYEFGSSPDEDEDTNRSGRARKSPDERANRRGPSSLNASITSNVSSANLGQQPTRIAGTNLRPNKASSTSIDQKLNTSFSSISDSYSASNMASGNSSRGTNNNPDGQQQQRLTGSNISASEEQLLIKAETASSSGDGGGAGLGGGVGVGGGPGSMSNMSNTSLSSATNSSRGNISQSGGNQSGVSVSSQKSLVHQQSSVSSQQQNPNFDSNVISERVKNLATQIYQELKRIISRCNYDEDILSGLMPLIVRVLESLDLALIENQQLQVELELCKDDNEQLVIMFDKEKAAKRAIDKKLIESEYTYEEERQQYQQKIESLDNIVKMCELKAKNASDQATRFEEKEAERKKEYNKLHDRYTDLLKSHCDIVERFRQLAGSSEIANLNVPHQMVASSSDLTAGELHPHPLNKLKLSHDDDLHDKNTASIRPRETLKTWNADTELTLEDASLVVIDDMADASSQHNKSASGSGGVGVVGGDGSSHNESDRMASEPGEGEHEKESENDSIAYTSMEKEFRKLIQENKDLLNTKNALNVVKDDLIAEVDRLTNEVSMYEQAVEQLNKTKDQMKHKVSTLDAELRKTKEELDKAKQKIRESNEEGVPYSQRKRFGRDDMAKVLMERNNYKERFMELQDAVRYTELVRANRMETEKRSGLWKFFSNLFGAPPPPPPPPARAILGAPRDPSPVVAYSSATGGTSVGLAERTAGAQVVATDALQVSSERGWSGGPGTTWLAAHQRLSSGGGDCIVLADSDTSRARVPREGAGSAASDASGYIHAYGWSLRASSIAGLASEASAAGQQLQHQSSADGATQILGATSSHSSDLSAGESAAISSKLAGLQVPIPQYCRPLTGDSLGMKIWCATAIDQSGGDLSKCAPRQVDVAPAQDASGSSVANTTVEREKSSSLVNISTSTPLKSPPGENRRALQRLERDVDEALMRSGDTDGSSQLPLLRTTTEVVLSALPFADDDLEELSSMVWICSTQHSRSKITIIDIQNKPNELLDSFYVPTFLYCIKSIPGCKPSDLLGLERSATDADQDRGARAGGNGDGNGTAQGMTLGMINELIANQRDEFYKLVRVDPTAEGRLRRGRIRADKQAVSSADAGQDQGAGESSHETIIELGRSPQCAESDAEISHLIESTVPDGIATLQKLNDFVAHTQPDLGSPGAEAPAASSSEGRGIGDGPVAAASYHEPISTHLPTVWMGGKDCVLYVHSAQAQWKDCVACVELPDSILQICHYRGRAFVALADGSLCVFFRSTATKQWDFSQYVSINVGLMTEVATSDSLVSSFAESEASCASDAGTGAGASHESSPSKAPLVGGGSIGGGSVARTPASASKHRGRVSGVHCLEIANKNLWLSHRNRALIFDPITMRLKHTLGVVPQVDNQIRQMVAMKDGVFICLRSDLTLRLYSSLRPYQHIQNIDIEPVVTRLMSPKGFVISHITSMRVSENTLWIGIAHGIILTIPCKLVPQISEAPMRNSLTGEFEESPSHLSIARFVPKCDTNSAQVSFHGHRDAVKFFIHANNFMLSGGQGYLDFRHDTDDQSKAISDKSHLILWQLPN